MKKIKFILIPLPFLLAGLGCKDPDTARSEDLGKVMANQASAMQNGDRKGGAPQSSSPQVQAPAKK